MRIFYAEDDKMMQKAVVYSLIRLGHEVTTVDDGREAIEVLQEEEFDVIILDMFMPHASGLDVVAYLRSEAMIETPVIMLSRNNSPAAIKKAMDTGVNDYLTKPFNPEELLLRIKRVSGTAVG